MDQALAYLAHAQNKDGGWGYRQGGASFTEPTALGLAAVAGSVPAAATAATDWLLGGQHDDGGWGALRADPDSGWHTTVAVWGLSLARNAKDSGEAEIAISRGAGWLLANRSRALPLPNPATKLQSGLAGWSWTPETFGWVIPTGLGLMALNATGAIAADEAVAQATSMLDDRRCSKGGWNWGNPVLFGAELPPYATETAIAILGLLAGGREPSNGSVKAGLDWLAANLDPQTGVTATAWAVLALRAGGRDASAPASSLRDLQAADGSWRSSPHATALAYLALNGSVLLP
jgi:Prenyltransferase and squalene oxidase repeat